MGGPIPNGDYRCRVIKVGAKSEGLLNFIAYPAFRCRIEPGQRLQRFTKLTGSQRQVGLIYPADALRRCSSARWCSATRPRPINMAAIPSATSPAGSSGSANGAGG